MFAEVDAEQRAAAVGDVVRLRLRHLVAALGEGASQRRRDRSLNLFAQLPHALQEWALGTGARRPARC
eukprot:gene17281-15351_t